MNGFKSFILLLNFISNLSGLLFNFEPSDPLYLDMHYTEVPDIFIKKRINKAFQLNLAKNFSKKIEFQEKVVFQNNCNSKNFNGSVCPSIGNLEIVALHRNSYGNYYVVDGCLANFVTSNIVNFTWIVSNSDNLFIPEIANSIDHLNIFYNRTISCSEVCLEFCPGPAQLRYQFKDYFIWIGLILIFFSFPIFYIVWRSFKDVNQVENVHSFECKNIIIE